MLSFTSNRLLQVNGTDARRWDIMDCAVYPLSPPPKNYLGLERGCVTKKEFLYRRADILVLIWSASYTNIGDTFYSY
jgi:hypothetical protein